MSSSSSENGLSSAAPASSSSSSPEPDAAAAAPPPARLAPRITASAVFKGARQYAPAALTAATLGFFLAALGDHTHRTFAPLGGDVKGVHDGGHGLDRALAAVPELVKGQTALFASADGQQHFAVLLSSSGKGADRCPVVYAAPLTSAEVSMVETGLGFLARVIDSAGPLPSGFIGAEGARVSYMQTPLDSLRRGLRALGRTYSDIVSRGQYSHPPYSNAFKAPAGRDMVFRCVIFGCLLMSVLSGVEPNNLRVLMTNMYEETDGLSFKSMATLGRKDKTGKGITKLPAGAFGPGRDFIAGEKRERAEPAAAAAAGADAGAGAGVGGGAGGGAEEEEEEAAAAPAAPGPRKRGKTAARAPAAE
jgi:hypothetical protein